MDPKHDPMVEIFGEFGDRLQGDRWQPDVDVFETETSVVVRAEIAGVRSQDLNVTVDGQLLRIGGVRSPMEGSEALRLHQMEIASGPFERRVRIPIDFDRDRVSAHVANGYLTVTLPKRRTGASRVPVDTR